MNDSNDDDILLIDRISKKDMRAMEVFYRRHQNGLYRFCVKKIGNEADANDIVNKVMMEAWNSADRFEGRSKVSTWLFSIANFRIIDLLRSKKQETVDIDDEYDLADDIELDAETWEDQLRQYILSCLKTLKADYQQMMELIFFQDAAYEEVAAILNCPNGTIKSRVFHAKKALKRCLEPHLLHQM